MARGNLLYHAMLIGTVDRYFADSRGDSHGPDGASE